MSQYNTLAPGSATASNASWAELRTFRYVITRQNLEKGVKDGLARFAPHFNKTNTLPTKASDYCIPGFNIELEATPGAGAGCASVAAAASCSRPDARHPADRHLQAADDRAEHQRHHRRRGRSPTQDR